METAAPFMPTGVFDLQNKMYLTYVMLKEDDKYLKSPATLPVPQPTKRKGTRNTKRSSFVVTTEEAIRQKEEETKPKRQKKVPAEDKPRKALKEKN